MTIKFFNNPQALLWLLETLWSGTQVMLRLFALTLLFSIPLGIIVAVGRMSRFRIIKWPLATMIYLLRSTPLMLQLMVVYFLLPIALHISLDRFWAAVFAFSINYAAYFAEIFRGGIKSILQGQTEAAQVLGFTKTQTYFRIILPQVIKRVLPAATNETITLVKDTSLAQVLAITELFTKASEQASKQVSVMPFLAAGLFYYLMNALIEYISNHAEKKMSYYS